MADLNTKIRGEQIKDGSIAASELATDAVETLKIKDANVTAGKLATDSVETAKIKAKNVTLAKIEDLGLEAHILVGNASLRPVSVAISGDISIVADGTVSIASGVIVNDDVKSDAAIAMSKLNLAITNSEVAADAAIALDKIVDMATTKIMIGSGAGNAEYALSGDVTMDNGGVVTIANLAVETGMLAADAVDGTKVADDAVGAEHINAGAEVDGYVLTTDAVGGLTWTAKSSVAEDYIQEAEIQKVVFAGDDVTVAFDCGAAPVANSVQVFLNGMLQEEGSGKDYTLASDIATFATAPITGDTVQIHSIKT